MQQAVFNAARQIQQENFAYQSRDIVQRIENRLLSYGQVLYGVTGLYRALKIVDRREFHRYVTGLRLANNFSGMHGIGFSLIIPSVEKVLHVKVVRKEGYPDYQLHPAGAPDLYTSIIYLESFSNRNLRAFGLADSKVVLRLIRARNHFVIDVS